MYFFFKPGRGRSRSKFIVSKEECSPQSWRGKKAGGKRDESAFQKAWIQEEHRAWKPGLWTKASFLCIFFSWVTYSGSTVTGNIKDPTVPETSPPNPVSRAPPTSLLWCRAPGLQGRLLRTSGIFSMSSGSPCISSSQGPIPSCQGSEARLLALQSPGAFWLGRAKTYRYLLQQQAPSYFSSSPSFSMFLVLRVWRGPWISFDFYQRGCTVIYRVNKQRQRESKNALRFASHCLGLESPIPTCCMWDTGGSEKGRGSPKVTQHIFFPCSNKLFFPQFCIKCQTVGHPQRRRRREPISQPASQPQSPLCYEALGKCNPPSLKWGGPLLKKSVKMPSFMHMPTSTSKRLYSQG